MILLDGSRNRSIFYKFGEAAVCNKRVGPIPGVRQLRASRDRSCRWYRSRNRDSVAIERAGLGTRPATVRGTSGPIGAVSISSGEVLAFIGNVLAVSFARKHPVLNTIHITNQMSLLRGRACGFVISSRTASVVTAGNVNSTTVWSVLPSTCATACH